MGRIVWFERYTRADRADVGGKNASLGKLTGELAALVAAADPGRPDTVAQAGGRARAMVMSMPLPDRLEAEVREAYARLCEHCEMTDVPVAVRSSATCEDQP